jgi:HAD superfamily hydrolase (TIGR01484 family)
VSGTDPQELAAHVAGATAPGARPLIALDHDGTLSHIAPRPDDAVLVEGADRALARLVEQAEVAIVSGRGLDDLVRRFDGLPLSLVSEHGLRCRLSDGSIEQLTSGLAPGTLALLRARLEGLLAEQPGWAIEDKGVALAVHHRLVADEDLRPTLEEVRELLEQAAAVPGDGPHDGRDGRGAPVGPGGHVQVGKAVLELRPVGADKGAALHRLAARSTARPVVMVGDDATDEPALLAAGLLGGLGVLVSPTARTTSATARLPDPDAVVAFLGALAEGLASRDPS